MLSVIEYLHMLAVAVLVATRPVEGCGPFALRQVFTYAKHPDFPLPKFAAGDLGVLQAIHADLHAGPALERHFTQIRAEWPDAPPVVFLGILTRELPLASAQAISRRLALSNAQDAFIADLNNLHHAEARIAEVSRPSALARLLEPFGDDALRAEALLADIAEARGAIERYRTTLRAIKPALTGNRLIELGMKRGPVFRTLLDAVLDARLDGAITTPAEEEALALRLWSELGSEST